MQQGGRGAAPGEEDVVEGREQFDEDLGGAVGVGDDEDRLFESLPEESEVERLGGGREAAELGAAAGVEAEAAKEFLKRGVAREVVELIANAGIDHDGSRRARTCSTVAVVE